jgi:hypothetical protein
LESALAASAFESGLQNSSFWKIQKTLTTFPHAASPTSLFSGSPPPIPELSRQTHDKSAIIGL